VERYLSTDTWHYISSPISDGLAGIFLNDYLMTSDPTTSTGWGPYITSPTALLQVMRGYAVWKPSSNPGLETFSGTLNTGTETFTGNRTATDPFAGWHLTGNPYPSSINLASGTITWDQFEQTAWFWNQGSSNYLVYPTGGAGTHTQYAPPEQGFYVHIKNTFSGSSTLTFTNAIRTHNGETFLKDVPVIQNELLMEAVSSANGYSDELSVHFTPDATSGYDPGFDAYKLWGSSDAPQIYTRIGDTNVTCNSLPLDRKNTVIPMGFRCGVPGMYTLIADSLGTFENTISIRIEDLKLGMTQDLRINPIYSFSYDTADNSNRFILHFDDPTLGVTDRKNIPPVQIYSFGNAIYIQSQDGNILKGSVYIFDLIGKELLRGSLSNQILTRITPNVVEGYYLVRVITGEGTYNGKVYLRKS
jgi:hypothetical protein